MTEQELIQKALAAGGRLGPSAAETLLRGPSFDSPVSALKTVSEADFLAAIVGLAHRNGWKVAHFRPARVGKEGRGWRTPVSADGEGFVDLVCVRERVIWIEAKAEKGRLRPKQEDWRNWLLLAGQEWYLWKPSDWPEIEKVLK